MLAYELVKLVVLLIAGLCALMFVLVGGAFYLVFLIFQVIFESFHERGGAPR